MYMYVSTLVEHKVAHVNHMIFVYRGLPVTRKTQIAKKACRLNTLVAHVVDCHNAAGVVVHTVAAVFGS